MKTLIPKIRITLLILLTVGCLLLPVSSYSQVSSAAFDPNCYFPGIGVADEIDTICGAHPDQALGSGMLNIGPSPGDSYGRISCVFDHYGDGSNQIWRDSIFSSGPNFNPHKLHTLGDFRIPSILRRGHFRSLKYSDILSYNLGRDGEPARIYWQDDQGNYDSSKYTELRTKIQGKKYDDYSFMQPYSAHISSDSVDDIIYRVMKSDGDSIPVYFNMLYFKGGQKLFDQGRIAVEDSSFFDTYQKGYYSIWSTSQGDYRGTGREDLIVGDYSGNKDARGNFLYYKNEPPFSMSSFMHAIQFDTLFAQWENPSSENGGGGMAMQALPKKDGDSSQDILARFITQYGGRSIQEYRIFKGGKDFGSNRWTADSAAFVLHEPYYHDPNFHDMLFGMGMHDCGDMTGTGNRVLYLEAWLDGQFYAYEYFYVLGNAIDDKVDMFMGPLYPYGGAGNNVDTLVADGDKYRDIIMGESVSINDHNSFNGSIWVVHGSKKIPVKMNSVTARKSVDESPSHILAYPNPCAQNTILTFDNCLGEKMKVYVVSSSGQVCLHEETPAVSGLQQYSVDLSTLSAGEYIINLSCPAPGWSSSVNVVKTGAAQTPWSFDLKKMVGR